MKFNSPDLNYQSFFQHLGVTQQEIDNFLCFRMLAHESFGGMNFGRFSMITFIEFFVMT